MLQEKIEHSIKLLKTYQDVALSRCPKGYIVGYSGGKDSDALVELFFISGVKFHIIHNHTTIDAPETVYYIRSIPNLKIDYSDTTIYKLIVHKHVPPTCLMRYCCSELKERGGIDRFIVTGVRWSESVRRRSRGLVEVQQSKRSDFLIFNNDNDDNC